MKLKTILALAILAISQMSHANDSCKVPYGKPVMLGDDDVMVVLQQISDSQNFLLGYTTFEKALDGSKNVQVTIREPFIVNYGDQFEIELEIAGKSGLSYNFLISSFLVITGGECRLMGAIVW